MARYKIRVLETGYDTAFPAGAAFDFWHMGNETAYSPFSVTLLQGEGHTILFDCGMDVDSPFAIDKIRMEKDQNCCNPDRVLSAIGVEASEVDSVIISHCHWDHMGGLKYFPNAVFYIQRKEYEKWKAALADEDFPLTHKMVVSPESMDVLEGLAGTGRVRFLDGDVEELFPGIAVRCASGHSFAQNMLFVEDDRNGRFAIVGDVAMRPESFTGTEAFPCFLPNMKFATGTIEEIIASYRIIMDYVGGDVSRIVAAHDGTRRERYPAEKSLLQLDVSTICDEMPSMA